MHLPACTLLDVCTDGGPDTGMYSTVQLLYVCKCVSVCVSAHACLEITDRNMCVVSPSEEGFNTVQFYR